MNFKTGCSADDVGEEDCGGKVERQHGSWVWCVWCGERLCHGAVGAQQCAGLCSLSKPCMAEGCKQRLGSPIIRMLYQPEKQLWHSHFWHRLCGCSWGMDPRKEGFLTILTHPHIQTRPAACGRWLGPVEMLMAPTWIPTSMEVQVLSHCTQSLPRVLVPLQTLPTAARSSICPPMSSMLLDSFIAPISLFNFYRRAVPWPIFWVCCTSFCMSDTFHQCVTDTELEKQPPPHKQCLAAAFRCRVGAETSTFPITTTGGTC